MGNLNLDCCYLNTTVPYCRGGYWSGEWKNFLTISLPSFWPCFFSISYGFSRPARHSRPRGFKALLRPLLLTLSWSLIFLCTLYSSCFRGLRPLTVWCCGQTASNDGKNFTAVTGGFQLLDLIITELKSRMTCYNSMPLIGWNYSIQTGEQIL